MAHKQVWLPEGTVYGYDRSETRITFAFPTDGKVPGWITLLAFVSDGHGVDLARVEITFFGDEIDARLPPEVLDARFRGWVGEQAQRPADFRPPVGGLTIRHLRGVRIGDLQTVARSYLSDSGKSGILPTGWATEATRRSGVAGKPDRHFAELAQAYVELLATPTGSRAPVETLAKDQHLAPSTVRNQLSEARRRGLLTSAGRGRIGGQLTDKARGILASKEG